MSLFPDLGSAYLDSSEDRDIKQRMEHFYSEALSINQAFWSEADTDTRFHAGDQTLWNELYGNLPVANRRKFNFNRIRRIVNMISGHQRRNRKSTVVSPVDNGDEITADQFTKIMMWIQQQEGILETISEAFQGSLITGMNLLQVWVDYRSDPVSGNIKVDNCSYNSFLIDPFFKKQDLSDCNGLWKRSFLSREECISLLPDHRSEIESLQGSGLNDNKFQYMPETFNQRGGQRGQNLLTYDEFYYRSYRTQKILIDSESGETQEWSSNDNEALEEFLRLYPQITVHYQEIPTVCVAVVVQGKVFYDGLNPMGTDRYPFVPVLAYYTPELPYFPWRVQGVVRGLRDAQYLYNRRKIIELDILESQVNSGWKYKENALVDPKDVFISGQGRGLALKQEAQMADVEQIVPPQIPPSMIQLSELLGQEISQISGVNEELLGSAMDDKAGVLSMLRQGAGLTTLQCLFDQLDRSQKLLGRIILEVVQSNFTPGKVKRIIEEEPAPQFFNKAFGTYDAAVEEGFNTTTQKQLQFAQLLQMKEMGVMIPDEVILKASTIHNKKELMQAVQQQKEQQMQIAQEVRQAEVAERLAKSELAKARAISDRGLGLERASRVAENESASMANLAEAEKDKQIGYLNIVKALKEVDSVDLENILKMLTIQNTVKAADSTNKASQNNAVQNTTTTSMNAAVK